MRARLWVVIAALLLWVGATAGQVWAHASLLQAEPAANSANPESPQRITLRFTEPLEPSSSRIELLDSAGQPVSTPNPSAVDPNNPLAMTLQVPTLTDGVYTVSWRALSTIDGHITSGVYGFIVGEATEEAQAALASAANDGGPPPGSFGEASPLGAVARMLTFIGGALLAGGFAMHLVLWRPLRATLPLDERAGDSRLSRLLAVGLGLVTAGTVLLFISQFLLLGSLSALRNFLLASAFGTLLVARFGLLAILDEVTRRAAARGERTPLLWGLGFSALLLGTISIWSHSAAVPTLRAAALLNDWLHLLAASIWIGGLAHLLFIGVPSLRELPAGSRAAPLATLIRRFSPLGICAVATLAVTGLYSGWLHVGSLEALRTTAYGQTLLVKLGFSVPLVLLAALNLLYWRRAVASAPAQGGFARTLGAETILGFGVLAVVGVLTALSPSRGVMEVRQAQALTLRQPAGPLQTTVRITPPRPGPARYEVTILGADGQPYDIARRVRLSFTPPDDSIGGNETLAEPQGDGLYVAEGAFLSLPGVWEVELQVQRPDGFDAFATFSLEASDTIRAVPTSEASFGTDWLPWLLLAAGVGLTLYAFWLRLRYEYVRLAPLVVATGVTLLGITALQFFDPLAPAATAATANPNPILPTEESLVRGEQVFVQHCQACHGPSGFGDGPAAAELNPPPANLHEHVPLMTDADAFRIISQGVRGTAMPSHKGVIAIDDHWHVINYLRRLTGH